jgi:hypothetical protein
MNKTFLNQDSTKDLAVAEGLKTLPDKQKMLQTQFKTTKTSIEKRDGTEETSTEQFDSFHPML